MTNIVFIFLGFIAFLFALTLKLQANVSASVAPALARHSITIAKLFLVSL